MLTVAILDRLVAKQARQRSQQERAEAREAAQRARAIERQRAERQRQKLQTKAAARAEARRARQAAQLAKERAIAKERRSLQGPAGVYFRHMLRRARRDGVPFNLSPALVETMLRRTPACPVLGIPLRIGGRRGSGKRTDELASFDRLDQALGYVPGNVTVMSWRANQLKSNATPSEIFALARWLEGRLASSHASAAAQPARATAAQRA